MQRIHKHQSSDLVSPLSLPYCYLLSFTFTPHFSSLFPILLILLFIFCPTLLSFSFLPPVPTTSSLQSKQSSSYSDRDTTEDDSESLEDMDFLSRQKKLQAEAKLALAMAKPMAKMQVEVEKQNRKKSPVADLVSTRTLTNTWLIFSTWLPCFWHFKVRVKWNDLGQWSCSKVHMQKQHKSDTLEPRDPSIFRMYKSERRKHICSFKLSVLL